MPTREACRGKAHRGQHAIGSCRLARPTMEAHKVEAHRGRIATGSYGLEMPTTKACKSKAHRGQKCYGVLRACEACEGSLEEEKKKKNREKKPRPKFSEARERTNQNRGNRRGQNAPTGRVTWKRATAVASARRATPGAMSPRRVTCRPRRPVRAQGEKLTGG
jgi:hypothetical protein